MVLDKPKHVRAGQKGFLEQLQKSEGSARCCWHWFVGMNRLISRVLLENERLVRVLNATAPQNQPPLSLIEEIIRSCEKLRATLLQTKMSRGPLDQNDVDEEFEFPGLGAPGNS